MSGKPAKPFGAKEAVEDADDEDGESDEESEEGETKDKEKEGRVKSPGAEEKADRRFYEQNGKFSSLGSAMLSLTLYAVSTGEENEDTVFSARAKLFVFVSAENGKKEWKERGVGMLKLNTQVGSPSSKPPKARLILRTDGIGKVVLNSPIQKNLLFGTPTGEQPSSGQIFFNGVWEGEMQSLTLRVCQSIQPSLSPN